MNVRAAIAVLLLAATIGAARADDAPLPNDPVRQGWYVAPMFSYLFPEHTRFTGQGFGTITAIGHHAKVASVEAAFVYAGNFKYADGAQLLGGQLTLVVGPMFESPVLSHFVALVGLGGLAEKKMVFRAQDGSSLIGDVGLGYLAPIDLFGLDSLLRLEVRYRADYQMPPRESWEPAYFRDWMVNLGLQVPLSPKPPPPPPPEPPRVVPPVPPTAQPDQSTAQPAPESGAPVPAESGASAPPPQ